MNKVVVDASVALAWCFPDESSQYADGVLASLDKKIILVPSLWGLELLNGIIVAERKKRLGSDEIHLFATLMRELSIEQDTRTVGEHLDNLLPLARTYGLTAYDSSYLELAIRRGAPLATLDSKLQRACKHAGITLFQ